MSYLKSNQVKAVFPTAYRNSVFAPQSDNTTEYNLTNLVTRIGNRHYVISYDSAASGEAIAMKVSIGGYIFELAATAMTTLKSGTDDVYLYIRTANANDNYEYNQLVNADGDVQTTADLDTGSTSSSDFQGLGYLKGSWPTTGTTSTLPHLKIFEYKNGALSVPRSSYLILDTSEIGNAQTTPATPIDEEFTTNILTVNNTSELKGITSITNNTSSTSSSTGALKVTGGVGIGENLNVGGTTTIAGATTVNNTLKATGVTSITNTTESSSTSTGALKVSGGVGIAKKLNVGGDTTIGGTFTVGTSSSNKNTTLNGATTINGTATINNQATGFKVTGGTTTSKYLDVQADTIIQGATSIGSGASVSIAASKTVAVDNDVDIDGSLDVDSTTHIYAPLTIGASGNTGTITIKQNSNKELTIAGSKSTGAQTVTFSGDSTLQAGDYASVSTGGSESITVGGNAFNIVTRDTTQTISGAKTHTGNVSIGTSSSSPTFTTYGSSYIKNIKAASSDKQVVLVDNNGLLSSVKIATPSATSTSGTATTFIYSVAQTSTGQLSYTTKTIPSATSTSLGTVKTAADRTSAITATTGGTTSGRYYGVEKDSNNKLFVNVPWTDSTYTAGTNISISSSRVISTSMTPSFTTVTASTSFTVSSDARLKENIKDYSCDKSILDLQVKEYDLKSNGSHHIGCIAQDLQEICPEIVHENADGYLSIEESKIVYLLLEEVKKLKKDIEELKSKE